MQGQRLPRLGGVGGGGAAAKQRAAPPTFLHRGRCRHHRTTPRTAQQQQQAESSSGGAVSLTTAWRDPAPGGVVTGQGAVRIALSQPEYAVHVTYCSRGRLLEPCERIWAHAGHSGWNCT